MFVGNVYEKAHEPEYFRDMKAHVLCVHFLAVKQAGIVTFLSVESNRL